MSTLRERLEKLPVYKGHKWSKYKEDYFYLLDVKLYPKVRAIDEIAADIGLTPGQKTLLHNASRQWKR